MSSEDQPGFKSFVSETELEEIRQRRQEQWEKVRKPEDPLEVPDKVYDPKSLFEKLQEQKKRKDEEFEESKKLKNMIKGLDNDELHFLESLDKSRIEEEYKKLEEEKSAIDEFSQAKTSLAVEEQEKRLNEMKKSLLSKQSDPSLNKSGSSESCKKSQAALLANAIKRKSAAQKEEKDENKNKMIKPDVMTCVGYLPGLCGYDSNSSESDSDSDIEDELKGYALKPYAIRTKASDSHK